MTKHSLVDALNRWIGEETGLLTNGKPRFCWMWAPDIPYWQMRLERVWVLAQWRAPVWTHQQWKAEFADRPPYPEKGMYHAMPESQLAPGRLPSFNLTQNYIWAMQKQMATSEIQHLVDTKNEVADYHHKELNVKRQVAQDDMPAFLNCTPGVRGGTHVSYGGI